MSGSASEPISVEALAEEFLERRRRGERPSVADYVLRYPHLAEEIREFFPVLGLVEDFKPVSDGVTGSFDGPVTRDLAAPPEQLGDYHILREVGRGGMGVVYEAEQESLGRRVALKVLAGPRRLDPTLLIRFHREAKAAGRLHHTNIVPVFGVGEQEGVHYFVMQFIQGQPLSEVLTELRRLRREAGAGTGAHTAVAVPIVPSAPPSAAEVARSLWVGNFASAGDPGSTDGQLPAVAAEVEGLTSAMPSPAVSRPPSDSNALVRSAASTHAGWQYARTVARLGAQAAEALEYASQQGVLHRDVKPANLLLDVRGTLWVTDFGLAKLAGEDDLTHTGDVLGTLRYMAPERFRGQADVRSDVYGLGLTLYELLALRPAFEETDRSRLIDLMTRAEPPRLLTLDPTIPRDLATIVHKAIARDPADRYPSAGALAADLSRFLEDRPIRARRLGPLGVTWRWARRNPAVAGLLGLVAALLIGITAGSMIAARRYREVAYKADQSAAEQKAVVEFVVNDVLGAAAPSVSRGEPLTVLEALARADRSFAGKFAGEPLVEAAVRQALAQVYTELGEYDKAEGHAARSLALRETQQGPDHDATLSAMDTLGRAFVLQGTGRNFVRRGDSDKLERGEALYKRMLEVCRRTHGDEDELTLSAMAGLATSYSGRGKHNDALRLTEKVFDARRKKLGPSAPETLTAMDNLAYALVGVGKLKEAEPLLRQVVEASIQGKPDRLVNLALMSNYAKLLLSLWRFDESANWAERSLEAHLRLLKFKHPRTQDAIMDAAIDRRFKQPREALRIIDQYLEQARHEFGPDDPRTLRYLRFRYELQCILGTLAEAQATAEALLETLSREPGPEDPATLQTLLRLAVIRRDRGEVGEAESLLVQFRKAARRALSPERLKWLDSFEILELRRMASLAEIVARNLNRPGRSDAEAGTLGGPPRIDAPFLAMSPVADGRIAPGEYGDGDGLEYNFADDRNPGRLYLFDEAIRATKEAADLSVRVYAAHTGAALFLAFRVRDQYVWADPMAARTPNLNDSVEVFLDGDRRANDHTCISLWGNREGFQLAADAVGNRVSTTLDIGDTTWSVGTSRTGDGYIIEFEIPLDIIDTKDGPGLRPAATGSELWMNVAVNDMDEAINKQTCYALLWSEDRLNSPYFGGEDVWPVALRLVPAPAPGR